MMPKQNVPEHEETLSESPQNDKEEPQNESETVFCDFQELDLNEPWIVSESKASATKYVPVVIHKKPKPSPIAPISVEVMKPALSGNIVEQEILMQQMREEEFRRESSIRSPVNGQVSPVPNHKPQVIGEVFRTNSSGSSCTSPGLSSQTNEFTAEIVLAPPNHYRDSSDSGTFDTESVTSGNNPAIEEPKMPFEDIERDLTSPEDDKKSFDPDTSSDLGDELQCTSPSINHTGSYESLNSVGTSGGSSVEYNPRKRERVITVRPLSCNEEVENSSPGYVFLNETPVEREIRINREREEELRIENRIRSLSLNKSPSNERSSKNLEFKNRKNASRPSKCGDPKQTIATSRIQQEIEEQTNRELELRSLGQIKTTSQDHVDSRTSDIFKIDNYQQSKASTKTNGHEGNLNSHQKVNRTSLSSGILNQQPASRRPSLPILNKGGVSMHKFISSGGKLGGMNGPFGSKVPAQIEPKPTVIYEPAAIIKKPSTDLGSEDRPIVRKSHCSAETKIQQELRQMKEREDELR